MLTSGRPIKRTKKPLPELERKLKEAAAAGELTAPEFPQVALEVSQMLSDEQCSASELARVVATDEVLSLKVLQRANGATRGGARGVTSLPLAIARIGNRELGDIVYSLTLGKHANTAGPLLRLRQRVWQEAVVSAVLARRIAAQMGVKEDEAFLGGLVHDIGRVLVLGALETIIKDVGAEERSEEDWLALVDRHHEELGTRAAESWELPEALSLAIEHHHNPRRLSGPERKLVDVMAIVDQIGALAWQHCFIAKENLSRGVKMPLKGKESQIASRIPGTGEDAATLVSLAADRKPRTKGSIVLPPSTVLSGDSFPAGGMANVAGRQVRLQLIARNGVSGAAVRGLPNGLLMPVTIAVDEHPSLMMCAQVVSTADQTELRLFALTPLQKQEWDRRFRAARTRATERGAA